MLDFTTMSAQHRPFVIAHRGASKVRHENTLEAFEEAIRMRADAVELDVRRTKDGVLVVHHNILAPRSRRRLGNLSYEQILLEYETRRIHLCTLEEALKLCAGRISLDIELKEAGYEKEVVDLVEKHFDLNHIAFTSFLDESVTAIKRLRPSATVGLLVGLHIPTKLLSRSHSVLSVKRVRLSGADFVAPNWKFARFGFLKRMSAAGFPAIVWTVDNISTAQKLADFGVTGIVTNRPDRIKEAINT